MGTSKSTPDSAILRAPGSPSVIPIHTAVRGRARFRVAGLYRSLRVKSLLETSLPAHRAIMSADANPLTGNLLVTFDPSYEIGAIAAIIAHAATVAASKNDVGASSERSAIAMKKGSWKARVSETLRSLHEQSVSRKEPEHLPWHTMDWERVVARNGSRPDTGLTAATAQKRLQVHGLNMLPESVPRSQLAMLFDQLSSTPILLLMAAAATSILTGGLADAIVILGVVGLNTAIGYITESQSERTIHSLKNNVRPSAVVIRDSKPQQIPATRVAVGDILVLGPGTYVAADSRLVTADRLSVDESALTGESIPVSKITEKMDAATIPLADRRNMVYMGTLVTGGQGLGVVAATGKYTEVGQIQLMTTSAEAPETPMQRQLERMGRQLVAIVSGMCVVIFGIGILRGYPFVSMLQTAIALAVAAVPEGLPPIATTILALGILRMRNLKVLIRRLDAVETLGSIQAICLDKTGTLTLNRMSVVEARNDGRTFQISNGQFQEKGRPLEIDRETGLQYLLDVGVLCSETVIEKQAAGYSLKGSATENALIEAAIAANRDVLELRRQYPIVQMRLRSEERRFMSTVHRKPDANADKPFMILLKGSPEQVLAMCEWQLKEGCQVELTAEDRHEIERQNEYMAGKSLRILACASRDTETELSNNNDHLSGLVWLGLLGLTDPLRQGMQAVIHGFHGAGIDTVMITGDQSPTAFAIGNQLHLSRNGPLQIVDSTYLAKVDPEVMKALAEKVHVFARVSPAHKLQIVRALQQANKVVAMTGDGINDSPALKAADIGIAMGTSGTDVAREVADIVLEDDELQTMLVAVSQGRTTYTNIRKAVHFLLSTNFSEVIVTFVAMAAGLGQPLSAMQLLWINLVSETSLGLALALDPPEPGVMEQPPRDPNEPIIRPADLRRMGLEAITLSAGSLGAYGYGIARYGVGPRASTLGFTSLITGQILHAFSARSEKDTIFDWSRPPNRILTCTAAGSFALQGAVFLIPWLKNLLGITTLSFADTLVTAAGGVMPLFINEGTKNVLLQEYPSEPSAARSQPP